MEAAARLLREKAPGVADAVGGAAEALLGPENPPVYHAMQAMNAADPMGLAGVGAPIEGAAKAAAMIGAEERAANFAKWFGKSKIVDAEGKPLRVYHGTPFDFDSFDPDMLGAHFGNNGDWGAGHYMTASPSTANHYAAGKGGNVMPVHASIFNPLVFDVFGDMPDLAKFAWSDQERMRLADFAKDGSNFDVSRFVNAIGGKRFRDVLKDSGHDGVVLHGWKITGTTPEGKLITAPDRFREVVAFEPTQIKSVFNRGTFDPADPSILGAGAPMPRKSNTREQNEQKAIASALRRKER